MSSLLSPRLGFWKRGCTQDCWRSPECVASWPCGEWPKHLLCTARSLSAAWRAKSTKPAGPLLLLLPAKKPLSSCWSSAPAGPVCGRGTRGGGAAETGHSQHANTNHFFVKSFPNGERRHLSHGPPPGVAPLPHSHLNRRTNSPTQMENRTTRERSILRNTWKLLTASVKYMKFW